MRNHWTNAALFCAGLYLAAFTGQAQAQVDCADWNTAEFFRAATGPDVIRCLGQGADIEARGEFDWTPLHMAARYGNTGAAKALLDAGADIDSRDEGQTPLHLAAGWGTAEAVNALLKGGAYIEAQSERGWTPLHNAARFGTPETVNALLDADASFYAQTDIGETPLYLAERYSATGAANVLRAAGATR